MKQDDDQVGTGDADAPEDLSDGARALMVLAIVFAMIVVCWVGLGGQSCGANVEDAVGQLRRVTYPRGP